MQEKPEVNHRGTEDTEQPEYWEKELTKAIIAAAIEVHRILGPGLLESAYVIALCRELSLRGIHFEREKSLPVDYKDVHLDAGYRLDIVVEGRVIVEVKAVDSMVL